VPTPGPEEIGTARRRCRKCRRPPERSGASDLFGIVANAAGTGLYFANGGSNALDAATT
jgi:hypothetical protein